MLDTGADRECFGFDMDAAAVQHGEAVARAMADRQYDVVGVDLLAACQGEAADLPVGVEFDVLDARGKAVFAAQGFDLGANALDNGDKPERADMGFAGGKDFLGCAGFDEFGQKFAGQVTGVLDAGIQLAVGECAGAALTELDVGFRVEDAAAPQTPCVARALAYEFAAFEDERPKTHLRQGQGGEEAARAGADDDGAFGWGGDVNGDMVGRVPDLADARVGSVAVQHRSFVPDLDIGGVNQADGGPAAGVVAAAGDGQAEEVVRWNGKPGQNRVAQGVRLVVQGKFYFGQAEHGVAPVS